MDGHLCCFHVLPVVNSAAISIGVQCPVRSCSSVAHILSNKGLQYLMEGVSNIVVQSRHLGSESKIQIPGPSPSRLEAEPR